MDSNKHLSIQPYFFYLGTHPWNKAWGEQRIDDGQIEVIGLTTYQLPLLQVNDEIRSY